MFPAAVMDKYQPAKTIGMNQLFLYVSSPEQKQQRLSLEKGKC